ncbi:RHS repeat-associated core domain-containing protein [Pseudomonas putida]|uniref:RHS repeat-associated core domain-containing protein n=1 Tax=Pseudomonas putida TaxID=303 RepID=UPI001EDA5220|nr:RHS repeat-associated core domain-containing protein [Pseudomonas putida]
MAEKTLSFFSVSGSPLALLGANTKLLSTNERGTVLGEMADKRSEFSYAPYGFGVHEGMERRHAFNGQRLDSVTGGYLLGNGHRQFAPGLMRFVSPDHLSPFGKGGVNCYVYCSSDPVNGLDPSGRVNIAKLFMPWRRTGLTRFMKEKSLPKGLLKPLLKARSSADRRSIYVYEANADGDYKHYRLAWGEAPDLLPKAATSESFAGRELYVKGGLKVDLKVDSDKDYKFSATDRLADNYGFRRERPRSVGLNFYSSTEAGIDALSKEVKSWFGEDEWNRSSIPGLGSSQGGLANGEVRQIRQN